MSVGHYCIYYDTVQIGGGEWVAYDPPWDEDGSPVLVEMIHNGRPLAIRGVDVSVGDYVRVIVFVENGNGDMTEKHTLIGQVGKSDANGTSLLMAPIPGCFGVARATL